MSTDKDKAAQPQDSVPYGIRVSVDSAVLGEHEFGVFDVADSEGNLSVVKLEERLHSTSSEGVQAASYSFERQAAGEFPPPKVWSLLSVFSGAFLIALFILGLINPELQLGLPSWMYFLSLGVIFFISTAMEIKRIGQFIILNLSFKALEDLEQRYGQRAIIDLPPGRLAESRAKIEETLKPLLPSKIGFNGSDSIANPGAKNPGQRGAVHGEAG